MTIPDFGAMATTATAVIGFAGIGIAIARMWGKFEARFDAQDIAIGEIKGTLSNAMARLGQHGEDIAVLMDRPRRPKGET